MYMQTPDAQFQDLPDEIVQEVCSLLQDRDLIRFSHTCRHHRGLALDNHLWHRRIADVWRVTGPADDEADIESNDSVSFPIFAVHAKRQLAFRQYSRSVWASPFFPHSLLLMFFRVLLRPHIFRPPSFVRTDIDPLMGARRTFWCLVILLSYLPSVLLALFWGRPTIAMVLAGSAAFSFVVAAIGMPWYVHGPPNLVALFAAAVLGNAVRDAEALVMMAAAANGLVFSLCQRGKGVALSRGATTFTSSLGLLTGLCFGVGGWGGLLEMAYVALVLALSSLLGGSARVDLDHMDRVRVLLVRDSEGC
jgi:hypothetical protein